MKLKYTLNSIFLHLTYNSNISSWATLWQLQISYPKCCVMSIGTCPYVSPLSKLGIPRSLQQLLLKIWE